MAKFKKGTPQKKKRRNMIFRNFGRNHIAQDFRNLVKKNLLPPKDFQIVQSSFTALNLREGKGSSKQPPVEKKKKDDTKVYKEMKTLLETELTCVICLEWFIKATSLSCSHVICDYCWNKWRKVKKSCPICQKTNPCSSKCLVIDNLINSMVEKLNKEEREARKQAVDQRTKDAEAEVTNAAPTPPNPFRFRIITSVEGLEQVTMRIMSAPFLSSIDSSMTITRVRIISEHSTNDSESYLLFDSAPRSQSRRETHSSRNSNPNQETAFARDHVPSRSSGTSNRVPSSSPIPMEFDVDTPVFPMQSNFNSFTDINSEAMDYSTSNFTAADRSPFTGIFPSTSQAAPINSFFNPVTDSNPGFFNWNSNNLNTTGAGPSTTYLFQTQHRL